MAETATGETARGMRSDSRSDSRPGVEVAALAAGFATALRRAGLSSSPDRAARLAEALRLVPPDSREPLYWACRVVFVSTREQLPIFDAVFSAVFDGLQGPAEYRGDQNAPPAIGSEPITSAPINPELRTRPAAPDNRPFGEAEDEVKSRPPAPMPGRDGIGGPPCTRAGDDPDAGLDRRAAARHVVR